jgi:hypothetical protein
LDADEADERIEVNFSVVRVGAGSRSYSMKEKLAKAAPSYD